MKGSKKNKLILVLSVVTIIAIAAVGTVAYLISTDKATNTFTVGDVKIKLDEKPVDKDGVATEGERVKANRYKLLPGHSYDKDPMITVLKKSEKSYVRMMVTVSHADELDAIFAPGGANLAQIFTGYDAKVWPVKDADGTRNTEANTITYEFRYKNTEAVPATGDEDKALEPLFTKMVVPGTLTGEQLKTIENMTLTIVGQAIQADGLNGADAAWAAFDKQTTPAPSVSP